MRRIQMVAGQAAQLVSREDRREAGERGVSGSHCFLSYSLPATGRPMSSGLVLIRVRIAVLGVAMIGLWSFGRASAYGVLC